MLLILYNNRPQRAVIGMLCSVINEQYSTCRTNCQCFVISSTRQKVVSILLTAVTGREWVARWLSHSAVSKRRSWVWMPVPPKVLGMGS